MKGKYSKKYYVFCSMGNIYMSLIINVMLNSISLNVSIFLVLPKSTSCDTFVIWHSPDILPFAVVQVARSPLLDQLQTFLPEFQRSTEQLLSQPPQQLQRVNVENTDDDARVVEMVSVFFLGLCHGEKWSASYNKAPYFISKLLTLCIA